MSTEPTGGVPEAAEAVSEAPRAVEELFYYNGNWFLYKPEPILPLPFDFTTETVADTFGRRMVQDMLRSMRIAPASLNPFRITGV